MPPEGQHSGTGANSVLALLFLLGAAIFFDLIPKVTITSTDKSSPLLEQILRVR